METLLKIIRVSIFHLRFISANGFLHSFFPPTHVACHKTNLVQYTVLTLAGHTTYVCHKLTSLVHSSSIGSGVINGE